MGCVQQTSAGHRAPGVSDRHLQRCWQWLALELDQLVNLTALPEIDGLAVFGTLSDKLHAVQAIWPMLCIARSACKVRERGSAHIMCDSHACRCITHVAQQHARRCIMELTTLVDIALAWLCHAQHLAFLALVAPLQSPSQCAWPWTEPLHLRQGAAALRRAFIITCQPAPVRWARTASWEAM